MKEKDHQNSYSSQDSCRKVPEEGIPNRFKLKLSPSEWENIKPGPGASRLKSGWTDLLALKLKAQNSYCVLRFKYHHVRKTGGRKKKGPYFVAKSHCKFQGCSTYDFKMKKMPKDNQQKEVTVRVTRSGNIRHERIYTKKRHTRRPKRKEIANELRIDPITTWYYKKYANMEDAAKMGGNVSSPRTQAVLRKIKSEQLLETNVHIDVLQEVKILNDVYRDIESDGFIRFLAVQPFQVHMYMREQLLAFIKQNRNHKGVLFFDATGSLVQKIPGQNQRIFLYALVMENPVEGRSVLPLAEFLSNDHHSSEIKHFLGFLCNDLKIYST